MRRKQLSSNAPVERKQLRKCHTQHNGRRVSYGCVHTPWHGYKNILRIFLPLFTLFYLLFLGFSLCCCWIFCFSLCFLCCQSSVKLFTQLETLLLLLPFGLASFTAVNCLSLSLSVSLSRARCGCPQATLNVRRNISIICQTCPVLVPYFGQVSRFLCPFQNVLLNCKALCKCKYLLI